MRKAEEVFAQPPVEHLKGTSEQLAAVRAQLMEHLTRADLARAAAQLSTRKAKLAATTRPISEALGEDEAFPAGCRRAWTWARVKSHVEQIEAREELLTLSERRQHSEQALSKLYKEMVALAAWLETKRNASPLVLRAMRGYATAIRRIENLEIGS